MSNKKDKSIFMSFLEEMSYSSDPGLKKVQKEIRRSVELHNKHGYDLTISFAPPFVSIAILAIAIIGVSAFASDFSEQGGLYVLVGLLYTIYYCFLIIGRKLTVMKPLPELIFEEEKEAHGAVDFATEDDIKNALK